MQYASQNIIPVTLELGGKSPNIFFEDIMEADDGLFDKALEGFTMFALTKGKFVLALQEQLYKNLSMINLWKEPLRE